jgi:hypothetical protein
VSEPLARVVARGIGRVMPRSWRLRVSEARARALSARTRHRLRRLAASGRPIIAGPYFGEVGFELLYWIPFLAWFSEEFGVGPERIIAVSRGGAASWYAHVAARYCDVFEVMDHADFRLRNETRATELGEQKQIALTAFDEEIIRDVKARAGVSADVLHPSTMYALFAPFWWGHLPIAWIETHARFRRIAPPPLPAGLSLPGAFTAVKFYFNDCFEDSAGARTFVQDVVRDVTHSQPVVSLSTGLTIDDHAACEPHRSDAVIQPGYEARTNLDVQTAIVSRASRFVGTYGGFAYLSPFVGVPATAYYTNPHGYSIRHLDVARLAIERMGNRGLLELREIGIAHANVRHGGLTCSTP